MIQSFDPEGLARNQASLGHQRNATTNSSVPMFYQPYPTFLASIAAIENLPSNDGSLNTSIAHPPNTSTDYLPLMSRPLPGTDLSAQFDPNGDDSSGSRFFRTRRCLFHQRGACVKGDSCTYAHCDGELKPTPDLIKTRLCQDWLSNKCDSKTCKFAHGRHELRYTHDFYKTKICHFWQQGGCTKGSLCRHAHGQREMRAQPPITYEGDEPNPVGGRTPSRDSTRSTSNSSPMWGSTDKNCTRQSFKTIHSPVHRNYQLAPVHVPTANSEYLLDIKLAMTANRTAKKSAELLCNISDRSHNQSTPNHLSTADKSLGDQFSSFSSSAEVEKFIMFGNNLRNRSQADQIPLTQTQPNDDEIQTKQVDESFISDEHKPANDIDRLLASLPSILNEGGLDFQSIIELNALRQLLVPSILPEAEG